MRILFAILLLLTSFSSRAQLQEHLISKTLVNKSYNTTIPFEYINGKIIISATINGSKGRFIFDTGALTILKKSMIDEKNFIKEINISDANQQNTPSSLNQIKQMDINGLVIKDIPVVSIEDSLLLLSCYGVDGLIGSNIFIESKITFDLAKKQLLIQQSNGQHLANVLIIDKQNIPYFKIKVDRKTALFMFDSGANGFGTISKKTKRKWRKSIKLHSQRRSIGAYSIAGFDKEILRKDYAIKKLRINDSTTTNYFLESSKRNRIGTRILEKGILTIDFKTKTWEIQNTSQEDLTNKSFNLFPLEVNNQLVVGSVADSIKTINVGDPIIEIENIAPSALSTCEAFKGSYKEIIVGKKATIKTKDGIQTIILKRQ